MRVGLKCTNKRENTNYLSRLIWRLMTLGTFMWKTDPVKAAQLIASKSQVKWS